MKKGHKQNKGNREAQHSGRKEQHPAGWVPVQVPPNFDEMYQNWIECEEPNVGWCMLCDEPIRSADDLIPDTDTHNCAAGRELDEKIRLAEAAASNRKLSSLPASGTMRNSSEGPRVGIFFVYDGKPFIQSTPVSEGEAYGNSRGMPLATLLSGKLFSEGVSFPALLNTTRSRGGASVTTPRNGSSTSSSMYASTTPA